MDKRKQRIIILLILALGLLLAWTFFQKKIVPGKLKEKVKSGKAEPAKAEENAAPTSAVQGLPVKVFRAGRSDYKDVITAMGNMKGEKEIDLNFEVQGVFKSFNFLEGEKIGKAEIIASLDPKDYRQRLKYAETKLKSARAELVKKTKEYRMYKKLYDLGAIIKLKLEQAILEYEQARLEVEGKKRELEFAELELDKTRIYAPCECVLGNCLVYPGELILPSTKVGFLVDAKTAIAEVGVVERDIQKLSIGQKAKLYVDAYPGRVFPGVITSIQPIVAEKSRTVLAKISVDNLDEALLSGMFTRVEIIIFEKQDAMMIPTIALKEQEEKLQVFIVEPRENKAKAREVTIGYRTDEYAEVTGGLSVDDLVILNADEVSHDMAVQVVEEEALAL